MAELGGLEQRLGKIEGRRTEALARVEATAEEAGRGLRVRRAALERALERFCRRHRPELERVNGHSRRSRHLLFGRVGYRTAQAVEIRSEATALRALAHWRAGQRFLRVRTELDREGLRSFLLKGNDNGSGFDPRRQRLRRAGIELVPRERWFYEVDGRAVEKWG